MQGDAKDRWKVLCEQAATEQDPVKLLKLITEINQLLLAKEERLLKDRIPAKRDSDYPCLGSGLYRQYEWREIYCRVIAHFLCFQK
jgi:hypothetical protein